MAVHQVCCDRCGQLTAYDPVGHFHEDVVCGSCREDERKPQGETVRLFEPAPAQMPGQLDMESSASRQHYIDTGAYLRVGEAFEV